DLAIPWTRVDPKIGPGRLLRPLLATVCPITRTSGHLRTIGQEALLAEQSHRCRLVVEAPASVWPVVMRVDGEIPPLTLCSSPFQGLTSGCSQSLGDAEFLQQVLERQDRTVRRSPLSSWGRSDWGGFPVSVEQVGRGGELRQQDIGKRLVASRRHV